MNNRYVYFSNNVVAPGDKITLVQENVYYKMQQIDEAVNHNNARYAHYYYKTLDDYDNSEYIYIGTENA